MELNHLWTTTMPFRVPPSVLRYQVGATGSKSTGPQPFRRRADWATPQPASLSRMSMAGTEYNLGWVSRSAFRVKVRYHARVWGRSRVSGLINDSTFPPQPSRTSYDELNDRQVGTPQLPLLRVGGRSRSACRRRSTMGMRDISLQWRELAVAELCGASSVADGPSREVNAEPATVKLISPTMRGRDHSGGPRGVFVYGQGRWAILRP